MLPSAARKALTELFLARLEAAPLDCYRSPSYRLSDATHEVWGDRWAMDAAHECFEAAKAEYERRHPLEWNNEKQRASRR